jgi:hypothetical protein
MAKLQLPSDFKEFLKLLNSNNVAYLLVGGYAVSIHGYVRMTNDIDVWVRATQENAKRVVRALDEFGFGAAPVSPDLFIRPNSIIRMGVPPLRVEILTSLSGVEFDACYAESITVDIEEIKVPVISLARLRENKAAAGRSKDLADLENLPR